MTAMVDKPQATPRGLVFLLASLTAFAPMSLDLYLPSLPTIGKSLHATPAEIQASVAVFLAGMAIGQVLYGPASDRFGRRPAILTGVTIYVAASIACALATTPGMLIGARFVQALGACAGAVVARAAVRDRFNHTETARMLSMMMMIMGLAPVLAPLLGGVLLHVAGWRSNFWLLTAFGAAVGGATYFWLKESRPAETAAQARSEHPVRTYMALFVQRRVMGYGLAAALSGSALFTYIATSPDLLIGTYGVAPSAFGWAFGVNAIGMIATSQLNRHLLKRFTPEQVLAKGVLLIATATAGLVLVAFTGWGGKWGVLIGLFAAISPFGLMQGNTMASALNIDPRRAGSISALMGSMSFAAGALGAGLASLFHDGTARPTALLMFLGMGGAALAIHTLALPRRAQV